MRRRALQSVFLCVGGGGDGRGRGVGACVRQRGGTRLCIPCTPCADVFFFFFCCCFFCFCFKARKCITYTEESAQPYEQKNIEMYTSEQLLYRHMMTSGCFSSPALLVDTIIAVDRETMNVPQLPSRDWSHCSVLVSGSVIC